ncbi:MAG: hypothetical protein B6229_08340 [Spirochaetaceae bacterium 4572_7]|nr:MAG: hypothetical protein B6229_08340 [Spirochaetaceae bacterium 4572_7]
MDIEILCCYNRNQLTPPDIFEAKLWKLLNMDRDNREVSEYLIWYLLGIENYRDIELVLERAENRYPQSRWPLYYRAILAGLSGEYINSLNLMKSEGIDVPMWELFYNQGIIEIALEHYSEAMILFNKSLIAISDISFLEKRDVYRSQIKTEIAKVLIKLDDVDEAIRVLNSAIELDPDNYVSDLLKSIYLNIKERE